MGEQGMGWDRVSGSLWGQWGGDGSAAPSTSYEVMAKQ